MTRQGVVDIQAQANYRKQRIHFPKPSLRRGWKVELKLYPSSFLTLTMTD